MDGVLIDSEPLWYKAEVEIYKRLGFTLTQSMYNKTIGMRYDLAVNYWYEKFPWEKPSTKDVQKLIVKRVKKIIQEEGKANEGVKELFTLLKNQNLKLALASSSPLELIKIILKKLQIKHYFDSIHSGEFEKNPKPYPDIFLTAAKNLNVKPDKCLVIEDSVFGVIAAKRASMKCIAVVKNKSATIKKKYPTDYYLTSLREFNYNFWKKINN